MGIEAIDGFVISFGLYFRWLMWPFSHQPILYVKKNIKTQIFIFIQASTPREFSISSSTNRNLQRQSKIFIFYIFHVVLCGFPPVAAVPFEHAVLKKNNLYLALFLKLNVEFIREFVFKMLNLNLKSIQMYQNE